MISIGFKPIVKSNDEFCSQNGNENSDVGPKWCLSMAIKEKLESTISSFSDHSHTSAADTSIIIDFSKITDILNPHSPYDIILEMEEPQVENLLSLSQAVGEKDAWLEWYDGLHEKKSILEEFLPVCSK